MVATGDQRARTESQRDWLRVRDYLQRHRHELAVVAADLYPDLPKVAGTPLLTTPNWLPPGPVPLTSVATEFRAAGAS